MKRVETAVCGLVSELEAMNITSPWTGALLRCLSVLIVNNLLCLVASPILFAKDHYMALGELSEAGLNGLKWRINFKENWK